MTACDFIQVSGVTWGRARSYQRQSIPPPASQIDEATFILEREARSTILFTVHGIDFGFGEGIKRLGGSSPGSMAARRIAYFWRHQTTWQGLSSSIGTSLVHRVVLMKSCISSDMACPMQLL